MPEMTGAGPVVLLVDDDLGFIFWLGQHLDSAGFFSLPAKNVSDAFSILKDYKVRPGVVILNAALQGAAEIVAYVRQLPWSIKIVGLLPEDGRKDLADVDVLRSKPIEFTRDAVLEWVRLLQTIVQAA
jgi:hypothetical protein